MPRSLCVYVCVMRGWSAAGADVNAKNSKSQTPLDIATLKGHKTAQDVLKKYAQGERLELDLQGLPPVVAASDDSATVHNA